MIFIYTQMNTIISILFSVHYVTVWNSKIVPRITSMHNVLSKTNNSNFKITIRNALFTSRSERDKMWFSLHKLAIINDFDDSCRNTDSAYKYYRLRLQTWTYNDNIVHTTMYYAHTHTHSSMFSHTHTWTHTHIHANTRSVWEFPSLQHRIWPLQEAAVLLALALLAAENGRKGRPCL